MRLSCLETFPSLLVENEVWTASSPDVWGRPTERRGRKQKQEGVGGSDDLRQRPIRSTDVWISVRRVCPRETQPGPFKPAGSRSRGSASTGRDAEFFPLRSRRDSSASRCSTKTHEEETKTINDYQRTEKIQHSEKSERWSGAEVDFRGPRPLSHSEKKLAGKISSCYN